MSKIITLLILSLIFLSGCIEYGDSRSSSCPPKIYSVDLEFYNETEKFYIDSDLAGFYRDIYTLDNNTYYIELSGNDFNFIIHKRCLEDQFPTLIYQKIPVKAWYKNYTWSCILKGINIADNLPYQELKEYVCDDYKWEYDLKVIPIEQNQFFS